MDGMEEKDDDTISLSSSEEVQPKVYNVQNGRSYYARYYFPPPVKSTSYHKLEFTVAGISYMTTRIDAELISGIIINHCQQKHLYCGDAVITDATAGLGGNTFSFTRLFKHVHSVERDETQYKLLENNIGAYNIKNVTLYNDDYLNIYSSLKQDVIFIDPPWGGKNYRTFKKLRLNLSGIEIEKIVEMLAKTNIVVLKLPLNYDMSVLQKLMSENFLVAFHKLKKMFIVVIYKKN